MSPSPTPSRPTRVATALVDAARALRDEVEQLSFGPPVAYVYDPLVYAWGPHRQYLERFARDEKDVVLLGMNPGPFGMAQTGVPFGEVKLVSDWMGIHAHVGHPPREHPSRPVLGFQCPRSEVSGARLWGAIQKKHPDPRTFFAHHLVLNTCPLLFLAESGANLTPDKIAPADRAPLLAACDAWLLRALTVLSPKVLLGIGGWAEKRARVVAGALAPRLGHELKVGGLPHPSPASPRANRGWESLARQALVDLEVERFL